MTVKEFTVEEELNAMETSLQCLMIYMKDLREAIKREGGFDEGESAGYNAGYQNGRRDHENKGYDETEINQAYESGYGVGRSEGYENGRRDFDRKGR